MSTEWPYNRAEAFLSERSEADLASLPVADHATHALGLVLQQLELPEDESSMARPHQTRATLYLAVQAGRSLRSMMALLRLGYEAEALIFVRKLHEISARMKRVTDESKGENHARQWLKGLDGSAGKVLSDEDPAWKRLDHVVHADHRGTEDHLHGYDPETGKGAFSLLPLRHTVRGTATLAYGAILVRDIAVAVGDFNALDLSAIPALDDDIHATMAKLPNPPPGFGAAATG